MQTYILQGSHKAISQKKFQTKQGDYLILSDRKPSSNKPTSFIVFVDRITNTRSYISSLYPNNSGGFNIEFKGIRYLLSISSDRLDINVI